MKSSKWLASLGEDEKKDLEASILAALPAFKRLTKLLEDKKNECDIARTSKQSYEKASWAYHQADSNGYIRCINEIIKLIEVE